MKGYIQVYTGNGKGKTTAALGLSLRAAGARLNVFIAQFIKSGDYNEIKALKRFDDFIDIKQYGLGCFIKGEPSAKDIAASNQGLKEIKKLITSDKYDIIIMDEANVAITCGLFTTDDLMEIIDIKPDNVELIITGRGASKKLIEKADLVTEMKEVKHYYQKGIYARTGIEK
mmetsp:Transcript_19812/g.9222  ORF Transcript_19812/g.9222 Transcript_19812/m.9222 type:complete len:172 (-) Transcript_19812:479-994(-)|eukprot:CAMPEP_0201285742 /NCGR_PEP_ID=MMETSP1317-20130820/113753_1 /ASSEMBLY_ACC=CAM_ASM_000770 /TAXON_ID=187299 /ORGANISM="Undescribed Undescribed, Strain Undescribed" /LENGTH=171 /DNA_ID=CAMNT_0047611599 /DNA_START=2699 /DNA_END=3214 /DNA_ORIENTATION=-